MRADTLHTKSEPAVRGVGINFRGNGVSSLSLSPSPSIIFFLVSLRDAPEHGAFITLTAAHPIGDSEGVDVFQRRNDARKVKPSVVDLESTSSSAR